MYFQQYCGWTVHNEKCASKSEASNQSVQINTTGEMHNNKRTASMALDGDSSIDAAGAGPPAKEKPNEASVSFPLNQRGTTIIVCNDCDNACQLRQSVEFHQKYCNKCDKVCCALMAFN